MIATSRTGHVLPPAPLRATLGRAASWLGGLRRGDEAPAAGFDARQLSRGQILGFRPGRGGLALRCTSGIVVVTQTNDPEDHVLHEGDEFRTARRGLVVAWAFTACGVAVRNGAWPDRPGTLAAAA